MLLYLQTVCTHGYIYVHPYPIASIAPADGGPPAIHHVEADWITPGYQKPKLGAKISKINSMYPHEYLMQFINHTNEQLDWVDPDARFNEMLFDFPEGTLRGRFARWNMWNGEELTITWENGTDTKVDFTVQLTESMIEKGELLFKDTKSLTDLCFLTEDEMRNGRNSKRSVDLNVGRRDLSVRAPVMVRRATKQSPRPGGYPTPLMHSLEDAMALYTVPGDSDTMVLQFRTFTQADEETEEYIRTYVKGLSDFLSSALDKCKEKGCKRVIIDVSGNRGGQTILPYLIGKKFFPRMEDFNDIDMKYSPIVWAYLYSLDNGTQKDMYQDINNKDFTSMASFLGPVWRNNGYYTPLWKQDYRQFGKDTYQIDMPPNTGEPLLSPDNIVVVSNGLCGSACHSMVESLQDQGVRAFAYGGRADGSRPMQAVGGTKGGKVLLYDTVQQQLESVAQNKTITDAAGNSSQWVLEQLPVRTKSVKVNSENKFRNGNTTPLQFIYTPACNRFFIDVNMFDDYSLIWKKTREIAWDAEGAAKKCADYKSLSRKNRPVGSYSVDELKTLTIGQHIVRTMRPHLSLV
jgi:hypothetical protein